MTAPHRTRLFEPEDLVRALAKIASPNRTTPGILPTPPPQETVMPRRFVDLSIFSRTM